MPQRLRRRVSPRLQALDELNLARADGTLCPHARANRPPTSSSSTTGDSYAFARKNDATLSEIMDDRHGLKSTSMTSQATYRKVVRLPRRSHDRRCYLRPHRAQCPPDRPQGPSRRKETSLEQEMMNVQRRFRSVRWPVGKCYFGRSGCSFSAKCALNPSYPISCLELGPVDAEIHRLRGAIDILSSELAG